MTLKINLDNGDEENGRIFTDDGVRLDSHLLLQADDVSVESITLLGAASGGVSEDELLVVLRECYRVLLPGGVLMIAGVESGDGDLLEELGFVDVVKLENAEGDDVGWECKRRKVRRC